MPFCTSYAGFVSYPRCSLPLPLPAPGAGDSSLRRLPLDPVLVVPPSCRLLGLAGLSPSASLASLASRASQASFSVSLSSHIASLASASASRASPSVFKAMVRGAAARRGLVGGSGTEKVAGAGSRCRTDPGNQWRDICGDKAALITT